MTEPLSTDRAVAVAVEVTIAAPPAVVWEALRDRSQVRHWHGWDAPEADAEVDHIYFSDENTESDDQLLLQLGNGDAFELVVAGESTVLRVTRGPRDPSSPWDAYFDAISEGWFTFAHQLRFALERHPKEVRRTIFSMGTLPAGPSPMALAGLADLEDRSSVDVAVPGEASGPHDVWFASPAQSAIVVPGVGDGLLVVLGLPTDGGGWNASAVLSTYGLSDERFTEVEAAWQAWWEGLVAPAA